MTTDLPHLNAEVRRFIKDMPGVYYDPEVQEMVRSPLKVYRIVYGSHWPEFVKPTKRDHRDALAHLDGDIKDAEADLAVLKRARAALQILTGDKP